MHATDNFRVSNLQWISRNTHFNQLIIPLTNDCPWLVRQLLVRTSGIQSDNYFAAVFTIRALFRNVGGLTPDYTALLCIDPRLSRWVHHPQKSNSLYLPVAQIVSAPDNNFHFLRNVSVKRLKCYSRELFGCRPEHREYVCCVRDFVVFLRLLKAL
jgi:hypothetical protein